MSESTGDSPAPLTSAAPFPADSPWGAFGLWLAVGALLGLIVFRRQLAPQEAQFLLEMNENPSLLAQVQVFWSQWAGTLEKASRSLSALAVWTGAGFCGLAAYRQLGGRAAAAAILTAAAWPLFFVDGTGIAHSALAFLVASALLVTLTWCFPALGRRGVAALVFLAAALGPYFLNLQESGGAENSMQTLASLGPGYGLLPTSWPDRATWLLFCAAGFGLLSLGGRRAIGNAMLFAAPLAGFWLAARGGIHLESPVRVCAGAILPPLSLLVAEVFAPKHANPIPKRTRVTITIALASLLALALAGSWRVASTHQHFNPDHDPRISLEWLTTGVDQRAWVLLAGDDRHLYLYYERRGHHIGQQTRLINNEAEATAIAQRSDYFDIPEIVIVGSETELRMKFSRRYEVAKPREGQPEDVVILQAKR